MEKHIPYFRLLDSFNNLNCPICAIVKDNIDKYFQDLLYENVNDVDFRKNFDKDKGFCNYHSYKFLHYNDGLAISLTHKNILLHIIELIDSKQYKKLIKEKKSHCIICSLKNEYEKHYLSLLFNFIEDSKLKEKILSSDPLCIPHFKLFLTINKNIPDWFITYNNTKYKQLIKTLEKYIDSCNYKENEYSLNLRDDEKQSWKKIINILFGLEGIL